MDEESIRKHIAESLAEVVPGADASALDPEVSFRDQIDMDSVDFLDFVLALEKRIGVRIAEPEYPRLSSLNGCARVVHAHLLAQGHP